MPNIYDAGHFIRTPRPEEKSKDSCKFRDVELLRYVGLCSSLEKKLAIQIRTVAHAVASFAEEGMHRKCTCIYGELKVAEQRTQVQESLPSPLVGLHA